GRAKAANVANAGRPSSKDRSDDGVTNVVKTDTSTNHSGSATWRLPSWRRQRQSVHNASGQAGQVNHSNSRPSAPDSRARLSALIRQRQRSRAQARATVASSAAARMPAAIHGLVRDESLRASGSSRLITRPPALNRIAMTGAPLSASPAIPANSHNAANAGRRGSTAI